MKTLKLVTSLYLAASVLQACTSSSVESGQSNLDTNQSILSTTSDGSGVATVRFSPAAGSSAFQITAQAGQGRLTLQSLTDPSGHSVIGQSSASAVTTDGTSLQVTNLPYSSGGVSGGQYTGTWKVLDSNARAVSGTPVTVTLTTKSDASLSSGTLRVNFITTGPVAGDQAIDEALHAAFDIWKEMYERLGISLDPQWYQFDAGATLPDPRAGSSFYESVAQATRQDAINLVFGSRVAGTSSESRGLYYGLPGAVPGPAAPSPRSAIAFSILNLTGGDGVFDLNESGSSQIHNNETRLLAEEMARLTGRYLGLESIVTFSGNRVVETDSLSDTPTCLNYTSCLFADRVKDNFMFPFPMRKEGAPRDITEYYRRDNTTNQQARILNASVFVD